MKLSKSLLLAAIAGLLSAVPSVRAESLLAPNDFVASAGDSITEIHRYTVFMEDYLLMCSPVDKVRLAQFGWGGTSAADFLARLDSDIMPWNPTVVTLCYGMNDGRFPDGRFKALVPSGAENYRNNITAIVQKLKASGVRAVVIGSPGVVDSYHFKLAKLAVSPESANPNDVIYNQTLADLGAIAREVAEKEQVAFADVHGAMANVMPKAKAAYGERYVFAGSDGIHPKASGSLVMAYAFLKALGCDGAIGTITVDLAAGKAVAAPGQKIVSINGGTVQVESSRYPFCFYGDPAKGDDIEATSGITQFFPFNEELNRYLLVVKGIATPKAKVTWGAETKEFSSSDLSKGINLAAEFLTHNPFSEKFAQVDRAVQAQQTQDLNLMKTFYQNLNAFKQMVPADKASLIDEVAAAGKVHELGLYQKAAALVTPVKHTITIEPIRSQQ